MLWSYCYDRVGPMEIFLVEDLRTFPSWCRTAAGQPWIAELRSYGAVVEVLLRLSGSAIVRRSRRPRFLTLASSVYDASGSNSDVLRVKGR